jgi:hypothetical protein
MANIYHDQLTGSDLHENKVNTTTGTELTPTSLTTLDSRWAGKTTTDAHIANTSNPHAVTRVQVGLGNVDNTSDANKPVSTAAQTALNAKANDSTVVHPSGTETVAGVKTFNAGAFLDKGNIFFDAVAYGAVADEVTLTNGAITSGTSTFTCSGAAFTSTDVGKAILITGAGGGGYALSATITGYTASTQVTISTNAGTTVSGVTAYYGTDNGVAINLALTAAVAARGRVRLPAGNVLVKTSIVKDADNVDVVGAGVGKTVLYAGVGYGATLMNIGNANGPSVRSNIRFSGMTIDMCQNRAWGLTVSWCKNIWLQDIRVINPAAGTFSMIYVGLFGNQTASWDCRGVFLDDIEIDYNDVTNPWEGITLGYIRDVALHRVRVLNKPGIAGLLGYNSEYVSLSQCYFYRASFQNGGRGPCTIDGTIFDRSFLKIYAADNVTMNGGAFIGDPVDYGSNLSAGVGIQGNYFATNGPEAPFYQSTFPYTWQCKNIIFNGVHFQNCNAYGLNSATTTVGSQTFLSAHDVTLNACTVSGSYWDGVKLAATYLTITNNRVYNNGQSGVSSTRQNFFLAATHGTFLGNQSYDDQGTPTALRDVVLTNEYAATYLPTQTWDVGYNSLNTSGAVSYYNGGFTATKPAEITVTASGAGDVVGPGSATDKAMARFSGTTGKTVQNSAATVGDAGNIAATIAPGGNAAALTLTQNDTTNNPRAFNVTNAGTGIGFNIAQNGNGQAAVIADAGTSTALTVTKNNTGSALSVTRNQANGVAAMVRFSQPQDAQKEPRLRMSVLPRSAIRFPPLHHRQCRGDNLFCGVFVPPEHRNTG